MKSLRELSDRRLLEQLSALVVRERRTTVTMLVHLCEVERRGVHRDEGFSSLFSYCVDSLRLSEDQAYKRIQAARLLRRFPRLREPLASGALSLSALGELAPHLTETSFDELIAAASGKRQAHNQLLAERDFGPLFMARQRSPAPAQHQG